MNAAGKARQRWRARAEALEIFRNACFCIWRMMITRSPFLGSHLAASVDGAWVEHKVQHQNYDWKLLTSIGKVMKL